VDYWPGVAHDLLCLNSDWLWEVNAQGVLTQWTPSAQARLHQHEPPTTNGQLWSSFLRADQMLRSGLAELLRHVKRREPLRCVRVACLLPHAGVQGWLRISGLPFYSATGEFLGYRGAAVNISGQMLSERRMNRLAAQNQNLLAAIEASSTLIMMADLGQLGWPVVYVNPAVQSVTGYGIHEVQDRGMFAGLAEPESPAARRLHAAADNRLEASAEVRWARRDGSTFWARVTLVPGCSCHGHCIMILMVRDITAERAYEQAQEQRTRLEALGRVAGGMAHEINNLLQPAQLNAEIMGDLHPDDGPLLHDITSSLEQISFIVRNTLQFSRKDKGPEIAPPVPVCTLLTERLDYIRALLPATVEIVREGIETVRGEISLNTTELTQVLTNLATNAAHAMKGHGTLMIRARRVEVDGVRLRPHGLPLGTYLHLELSDTGCGMSEAVLARVFEPFFTTKPVGEGTGLGLAVVFGLVQGWGGSIDVRSAPGQGTTFTLLIPMVGAGQQHGGKHEQARSIG